MQALISLLLTIAMFLGLTGVGRQDAATPAMSARENLAEAVESAESIEPAEPVEPAEPAVQNIPEEQPAGPIDVNWADIEYRHYDPESFYAQTELLTSLAQGTDSQAVIELYDELYEEFTLLDTLSAVAYVRYSQDVTDAYWSGETVYTDTLLAELGDALCTACHKVMRGPCRKAFTQYVGHDAAFVFDGYVPMTDREAELTARESELINEYYELMNTEDELTYTYLGETWNWEKLEGFQGTALRSRDYDGYLEIYYGLEKAMNELVGPVYLELVQLRTELASIAGYDCYTDYVYELQYGRDYAADDAQALCQEVKALSGSFFDLIFGSDLMYAYGEVSPIMTGDELIAVLGDYVDQIDPTLTRAWEYMTKGGLTVLTDNPNSIGGAFTISLSRYNSACLFISLDGDCYDLEQLTHEFGHFTDFYCHPLPNLLTYVGNYDLMEIHSTGLETLFTSFYDQIYDEGAEAAQFITLAQTGASIVDGCLYDEFQRRIYADPDMTLDDINRLYASLCEDYGKPWSGLEDGGYSWMYVSHNFEAPLYYISYAASALAALQIWEMSRSDFQVAVDAYMAVLDCGAYDGGYLEVLDSCGLRLFTEEGVAGGVIRSVMDYLEQLT